MMKRTKRRILAVSLIALGIALLTVGGILFFNWWNTTYITINGRPVARSCEALDMEGQQQPELEAICQLTQLKQLNMTDTGITAEQYLHLKDALPGCAILWSVPFQGSYLPNTTTELTISTLTQEDIDTLVHFPALEAVDALAVTEQDILLTLRQQHPNLRVMYDVHIGTADYDHAKQNLALADVVADDLTKALPHMQQLEKVAFTGQLPETKQLIQWKKDFPGITFIWDFEIYGRSVNTQDTELILNEVPMDSIDLVAEAMECFNNMERVEMCYCGLPSTEMAKLVERFPNTKFVWVVKLGWVEVRTDITAFMPYKLGFWGGSFDDRYTKELKYCTDIICMDLGHQAVKDLSFLNYMPHMQYLILGEIPARDFTPLKNLKELKYLEIFLTEFRDASLLSDMKQLVDLNICYTAVNDITPLLAMKDQLQHLWMNGTHAIDWKERQQLRDTLVNTVIRHGFVGSTEGGWRDIPNYFVQRDLLGMHYMKG